MRGRGTAALLALAALFAVAAPAHPARAASPTTLLDAIRLEADYIVGMRDGFGVITTHPDRKLVIPYQANFAAMGLARAYALLRDNRYSTAAWRWLEWYRDHMYPNGTMPDWQFGTSWIPRNTEPDSTDSYAGTYLSAVLAAFEATGDLSRLRGLKSAVSGALDAIYLTQDTDGLHFAKPGYPVKYTMDEAETYAGLRAAETLGRVLADSTIEARARAGADGLLRGSANLVDPATGLYLWGIQTEFGVNIKISAPISWIYPGASAQAWAVVDGLTSGANALSLMARVEAAQPNWDRPDGTSQYADAQPICQMQTPCFAKTYYWPRFALAHLAVGNTQRALTGALNIYNYVKFVGHPYPFTPGDAGCLILLFGDPEIMAATLTPTNLPPIL